MCGLAGVELVLLGLAPGRIFRSMLLGLMGYPDHAFLMVMPRSQEGKSKYTNTPQASALVTSANMPLAKASQWPSPKLWSEMGMLPMVKS